MAGFHNTRYDIERDCLLPPLSLQRSTFPGIEEQHGQMAPEQWKAYCDRITLSPAVYFGVGGSPTTELKRRLDAAQVSDEEYLDVVNVQVIYLLLWLRRVVFQGAVFFLFFCFAK